MTEPGDSGSWVINATTGSLYGMLIAGCSLLGTGYLVPMSQIFDDIRKNMRGHIIRTDLGGYRSLSPTLPSIEHMIFEIRGELQALQLISRIDIKYLPDVLIEASRKGHKEVVNMLLRQKGIDINKVDVEHGSALFAALMQDYEAIVKLLLKSGADVNLQYECNGNEWKTALYAASERGNVVIVRMLIDNGADINFQNGSDGNSLTVASLNGYKEVVELLLNNGADPNAQSGPWGNALQAASFGGHKSIVRLFLYKGVDPNAPGGRWENALQAACVEDREVVVELLLIAGANINVPGEESPLISASSKENKAVVKMLLQNGADYIQNGLLARIIDQRSASGRVSQSYGVITRLLIEKVLRTEIGHFRLPSEFYITPHYLYILRTILDKKYGYNNLENYNFTFPPTNAAFETTEASLPTLPASDTTVHPKPQPSASQSSDAESTTSKS